jgi:hypothetical protein
MRTSDEVVSASVPELKSMATSKKGLADARVATADAHAMAVAGAAYAGQGAIVGVVDVQRGPT